VTHPSKVLYVIVCAADAAGHVGRLITLAQDKGWESLRAEGIPVLLDPGRFEPHAAGTGSENLETYPWALALEEVERRSPR
jgi:hypothetical protein